MSNMMDEYYKKKREYDDAIKKNKDIENKIGGAQDKIDDLKEEIERLEKAKTKLISISGDIEEDYNKFKKDIDNARFNGENARNYENICKSNLEKEFNKFKNNIYGNSLSAVSEIDDAIKKKKSQISTLEIAIKSLNASKVNVPLPPTI